MAMPALDIAYREAVRQWVVGNGADLAASFLLPRALIARLNSTQIRADEIALSKQLTHCFNQLDRQVYKSAHRYHDVRVPRFVALERTDEIGWHAHVLIATPAHLKPSTLSDMVQRLWLRQLREFISPRFADKLYWAEHITGNYLEYSTKHVGGNGSADWMNMVFKLPNSKAA
jgi:hypothetical protein